MKNVFSPHEQALVAFISEVKSSGQDIEKLVGKVNSGIMGNTPYAWVSAEHKSAVLEALAQAVKSAR